MKTAIIKRSIVLHGHKTSVSLENEFWEGLREIADRSRINVSNLAQQIDDDRKGAGNLSSAIRVYVLNQFRARVAGEKPAVVDRLQPRLSA
jgi:predicted DNA-binding ribbon-helix-helix protein